MEKKRLGIGASIGLAIIIGFLYTPNLCLENFDEGYCGYDTKQDEKVGVNTSRAEFL